MKKIIILLFVLSSINIMLSQETYSPRGCSVSTGPNVSNTVLEHPECRYHLVVSKWSEIEISPGGFSFSALKDKINMVKSYNKKYSLAVAMGGPGSPAWLFDSMNVPYLDYKFRGTTPYKLPLWWDSLLQARIKIMVDALGKEFGNDTSLALVYITQMTANGNEGHLLGINMDSMRIKGFTSEKWISSAKQTARYFADAFPSKSLAFEIHDIDNSPDIPIAIINELYNDTYFLKRIGPAIWWLSGKTTYQNSLLEFLKTFTGNKYAQFIGNSTQPERFGDSTIASAFEQAKELNIRYIEPWFEEYKNGKTDSLLHDFNCWVDSCNNQTSVELTTEHNYEISVSPSPASEYISISSPSIKRGTGGVSEEIKIFNTYGECVINYELQITNYDEKGKIDISHLPTGLYFIKIGNYSQKFMVVR
jgi:hypothetical protein